MLSRIVAGGTAALAVLTACGSSSSAPPELASIGTLISTATGDITQAKSYHLVMSYSEGGAAYRADLHISTPSAVTGTISENGASVQVIQTDGKMYVQGKDYIAEYAGSMAGRLYGDRWVLTPADLFHTTVIDVVQLTSIATTLLALPFHGKRTDHVPAAAQSTAVLTGDFGSMYIMEDAPHYLVKVETAKGYVPVPGYSDVSMEILDYGETVAITAPKDFADPNSPVTLPPEDQLLGKWNFVNCDTTGCGFKATVTNRGGMYATSTPSTFTFSLFKDDNKTLVDKCSGPVPVVPYSQNATISCRVASQAWRNYAFNGGVSFYGDVLVDNPSYDG